MTTTFDMDDLRSLLRSCAGEPESVDLDSDIATTTFEELGYDSIAIIELAACVKQNFGVAVSDTAAVNTNTSQDFVDHVRGLLTHGNTIHRPRRADHDMTPASAEPAGKSDSIAPA
ncbi:acyl carrier protein [Amycolatopsis sp. lyj-90]|uniref:acyl carrier protein n=1 Tax=Amycolatopsis sp. lyj-90 TaxID=2789285 RepID=UPI00397C13EC